MATVGALGHRTIRDLFGVPGYHTLLDYGSPLVPPIETTGPLWVEYPEPQLTTSSAGAERLYTEDG